MRYFYLGLSLSIVVLSLWVQDKFRLWVARRLGDPNVAARQRSPENPFARVDWIGSVLLPFFLLFRGLPVLGWTKPLEIDLDNLNRPRRDGIWIAVSGPAAHLMLALAGIGATLGLQSALVELPPLLIHVLYSICHVNACLCAINLLPIPPLAASAAAEIFLNGDALSAFEDIKPYGFLLLLVGAYFNFFDFLTTPLTLLVRSILGF